ncbi:glycoside hydrolase family 76 protein [uncultured Corynebacterium sp.]|uniref:glycoside hydrolase family 76 protein n=1 Tax=uncultured Corynebacterium sp. TaxID=159447 RepID=UPI0025EDAA93|nr:glycoside hydrolase family 76 protein [uncultured Corynebacterium sp.]
MLDTWVNRADLAESAINERHAARVWGLPRTNLGYVAWPANGKEKLFFHWHYWWQAHYLDCLVDAARRRTTKARRDRIRYTMRGIAVRNVKKLSTNRYYDDKAWLALAMGRAGKVRKVRAPKALKPLESNIVAGVDSLTGVLPWRSGETFYNVPSNGPAAIMMARTDRLAQAIDIVEWIFDNLIDVDGLVMDGLRMRMHGPELVRNIHPYCQGVALGACLEIALKLRERQGVSSTDVDSWRDADKAEDSLRYIIRIRELVDAISRHMANRQGVIDWDTGDGDGGLFKGILVRYLADVAVRLPDDSVANRETKRKATRMVIESAESVWNHRLEVDGLPVFATDWTADARLPQNFGLGSSGFNEIVSVVRVDERDLSVQLSGWMLMEAAAHVAEAVVDQGNEFTGRTK